MSKSAATGSEPIVPEVSTPSEETTTTESNCSIPEKVLGASLSPVKTSAVGVSKIAKQARTSLGVNTSAATTRWRKPVARRPNSARELDLQTLKQASACVSRALELFGKRTVADDKEAAAQAQLAWRFLDEFVDKHGDDA